MAIMCGVQGKQLRMYTQTNDGGKGREKTNCVECFVSECQVVSDSRELGVYKVGFLRQRGGGVKQDRTT